MSAEGQIHRYVERLLRMSRHGGRCVARDEDTVLLYDVASWGDAQTRVLQARFPDCEVSCEANSGSMSGFVVIVRRHSQSMGALWASLFVLVLLGVSWTVRSLLQRMGA